jgi:thiamine-phosphate pyrophosphorylase
LGEGTIIGYSTHNVDQAVRASSLPIDYLAIGPVYATSSKTDPDPVVGLDGVREVRAAIGDLPLVAIGGITTERVGEVLAAGADCVACISQTITSVRQ